MLLDPLRNLGEMLILLADIVLFREIDQIYNRFGGEEEKWVDDLDLYTVSFEVSTPRLRSRIMNGSGNQSRTSLQVYPALLRLSESWDYRAIALCHLVEGNAD